MVLLLQHIARRLDAGVGLGVIGNLATEERHGELLQARIIGRHKHKSRIGEERADEPSEGIPQGRTRLVRIPHPLHERRFEV